MANLGARIAIALSYFRLISAMTGMGNSRLKFQFIFICPRKILLEVIP